MMVNDTGGGRSLREIEERIWKVAESASVSLFITNADGGSRARPMGAAARKGEHAVYFLTAENSEKISELADNSAATVSFMDSAANNYVSLSGRASVSNDREKIRDIWTPFAKAWWDSADDPAIRLVTFVPECGELWDGPNKLVATILMLTAAATGARPSLGHHDRVPV